MNAPPRFGLFSTVVQGVVSLLVVAVVARVVWELLAPLLPSLGVFFVFLAIGYLVLPGPRGRR